MVLCSKDSKFSDTLNYKSQQKKGLICIKLFYRKLYRIFATV